MAYYSKRCVALACAGHARLLASAAPPPHCLALRATETSWRISPHICKQTRSGWRTVMRADCGSPGLEVGSLCQAALAHCALLSSDWLRPGSWHGLDGRGCRAAHFHVRLSTYLYMLAVKRTQPAAPARAAQALAAACGALACYVTPRSLQSRAFSAVLDQLPPRGVCFLHDLQRKLTVLWLAIQRNVVDLARLALVVPQPLVQHL